MLAALSRTPSVRLSAYSRISSPQYQTARPPTSAPRTNLNIAVLLSSRESSKTSATETKSHAGKNTRSDTQEKSEAHGAAPGLDRRGRRSFYPVSLTAHV